jgi:hypothetical protein
MQHLHNNRVFTDGLRVISDGEKLSSNAEVGAVVYWNGTGAAKYDPLRQAWEAAGLDAGLLPDLPSPETALRRAVRSLQEQHLLTRPLARRGKWAIVQERIVQGGQGGQDLAFSTEAKVELVAGGQLRIEPDDVEQGLREKIQKQYQFHLQHLTTEDISSWLVGMAAYVSATSLRRNGGFYFVPPSGLSVWRIIEKVLNESTGYVLYEIPAGRGLSLARAVLDSLTHEMKATVEDMDRELIEANLGGRALRARSSSCDALLQKVSEYEPVVGRTLDEVRQLLGDLQMRLTAAALMTTEV